MKKFIKICGVLLAILWFSAMLNSCEPGVVYADYFIDGKIVSKETDNPVKDLKVSIVEVGNSKDTIPLIDAKITDENGEFAFVLGGDVIIKYIIEVQDIDGEANGTFNDTIINVTISEGEFKGGDRKRYKGEYRKSFDIKLNPKK